MLMKKSTFKHYQTLKNQIIMAKKVVNITSAQNRTWSAIFQSLSISSNIKNQHAEMITTSRSNKTLQVIFEDEWGRFFSYNIAASGAITEMSQVEDFDGEHIQGFPLY